VNSAHNVRVFVKELQEAIQTPEETAQTTLERFHKLVVVLFQFSVHYFKQGSHPTEKSQEERTKGRSSQMVSESERDI